MVHSGRKNSWHAAIAHQVVGSWAQLAGSGPRPPRTPAIRGAGATGVHGKIGKIGKIGKRSTGRDLGVACLHPLAAGFRPAQVRCLLRLAAGFRLAQLGSKDPVAGLKHHGSEGRSGPAASSPDCQTALSEVTRH